LLSYTILGDLGFLSRLSICRQVFLKEESLHTLDNINKVAYDIKKVADEREFGKVFLLNP